MSLRSSIARTIRIGALTFVFAILAGATYQGVSTAIERREFPRPGGLVDVGGHQLHVHCQGAGRPTVVFEAPALATSAVWGWVAPAVAAHTRVCTYDRAGLGWSEASDGPYTPAATPDELHALLGAIEEPGPIVLVGHGLGAAFARLFAARYPATTAGLVLLAPPDLSDASDRDARFIRLSPWLARAGVLRVAGTLSRTVEGLPGASGGAMRAFLNRPDHLTRSARELARAHEIVALARAAELDSRIEVRTILPPRSERFAMLTRPDEARIIVSAVAEVVSAVRRPR